MQIPHAARAAVGAAELSPQLCGENRAVGRGAHSRRAAEPVHRLDHLLAVEAASHGAADDDLALVPDVAGALLEVAAELGDRQDSTAQFAPEAREPAAPPRSGYNVAQPRLHQAEAAQAAAAKPRGHLRDQRRGVGAIIGVIGAISGCLGGIGVIGGCIGCIGVIREVSGAIGVSGAISVSGAICEVSGAIGDVRVASEGR